MEQSELVDQIKKLEEKLAELKKKSDRTDVEESIVPRGKESSISAIDKKSDTPSSSLEQGMVARSDITNEKLSTGSGELNDENEHYIPIGEVGVFDGEFVIMPNAKKYQVPPNYASKSRLVVGDRLKLMAHGDANSFKVIEQVPRKEVTGILTKSDNQWVVFVDGVNYFVIAASIRYYEGEIGDKVVIQIPEESVMEVKWAAVKSVIKKGVAVDPEKRRAERAEANEREAEESKPRVSMYGGVIETSVSTTNDKFSKETGSSKQPPPAPHITKRDVVIEQNPVRVVPMESKESKGKGQKAPNALSAKFPVEVDNSDTSEGKAPSDVSQSPTDFTDDIPDLR